MKPNRNIQLILVFLLFVGHSANSQSRTEKDRINKLCNTQLDFEKCLKVIQTLPGIPKYSFKSNKPIEIEVVPYFSSNLNRKYKPKQNSWRDDDDYLYD